MSSSYFLNETNNNNKITENYYQPRRSITTSALNFYGRNSFRPPLPFRMPDRHLSLTMLKSDQVLAHLSQKNGGSSVGLYDLNEEMRSGVNNDFSDYQNPGVLLNPLLHQPMTAQRQHRRLTGQSSLFYHQPGGSTSTVTAATLQPPTSPPLGTTSVAEIRYPDFEQWLQTAGNISYVTSVMLARSKSESTLSEMSDMTNTRRKLFPLIKKQQRRSRLNYHDLGKSELREGIRQHHIALLRWTNLVGRLSKQLSSAFSEFAKKLEQTSSELRVETEKTNRMFRNENVKNPKPTFVLGRTLDKIWLTVLDNVSDQARIFNDLSKTLTLDFAPSFTELIDHHEKFIGQIYAFECGLEQLLSEYRQTTDQSCATCERAKSLALSPIDPRNVPKSGLGSLAFAVDTQNAYVLNLHNYNTMVSQYETSLMPILVEEMEEASTDLMTYGVKFLEAITQLIGKRYGELKGRMEVVEYACRYQSKARSDISAYVRAYLDTRPSHRSDGGNRGGGVPAAASFQPIPVSPKNQLLAVEENEHKLSETADAISEEIYDMADLRRTKQIELEKLEEKYHACLSNIGNVGSSGAANCETGSGGAKSSSGGNKAGNSGDRTASSAIVKEALPSFSTVTFALKENIADARRMVALATAKLNSLKHQMDLLSATRRQPPPSNLEAEFRGQTLAPGRLPHQPGGGRKKGLRRSLTQWFSFLTVSNGNDSSAANSGRGLSPGRNSAGLMNSSNSPDFGDDPDADDYPGDHEYHPTFRADFADDSSNNNNNNSGANFIHNRGGGGVNRKKVDDDYYLATYDHDVPAMPPEDDETSTTGDVQIKEKTTIFSVKGFKKTIDRIRRIASEDHPAVQRRRRDPHRAQSHDPDPVYALLKCAARLNSVNLESHATNCMCDECPARRLVSGVQSSLVNAQLALTLPHMSMSRQNSGDGQLPGANNNPSSSAITLRKQSQQINKQEDQFNGVRSSMLVPEHPATFSRNRLSSATSSSLNSPTGLPPPFPPSQRSSMIVIQQSSNLTSPSITSSTPYNNYQHQASLTNLRR